MTNRPRPILIALAVGLAPIMASAQTPTPTTRTTVAIDNENIRQAVTAVVIRDGKLGLIGSDRTRVRFLPTGVYTNQAGIKIVVLDGLVTELAGPAANLGASKYSGVSASDIPLAPITRSTYDAASKAGTDAAVVKVSVQSVVVARDGTVRAISGVGDRSSIYLLPDGKYLSAGGNSSIIVQGGRPTYFTL